MPTNARIIARNSLWYGFETLTNLFLTFFTSIVIARSVGPTKLGYFLYVAWIVGAASSVGGLGIPAATRKYMAEYYGRGELGVVRTVFYTTLRLQMALAVVVTLAGLTAAALYADREYRTIALLMVGSAFPFMVNSIASGANTALEDMRANVPGSLVSTAIFVAAVFSSVAFGWGLLAIAAGTLAMRAAELVVRVVPLVRRMSQYPAAPLDEELRRRMIRFSGQSVVLMVLTLIVWDRSEMVVLKGFCPDIRQIAFYSVAFNITERLLTLSQVFGTATGATIMAQYGRDKTRVSSLIETSLKYLALISFPVHFGLAAIAGPAIWIVYGAKYSEAAPALVIAACLGIPKAFFLPVQAFLSSMERQDLIIRWGVIAGALNIALDFALIPRHGAVGAALANGTTQTFSAAALWIVALRLIGVQVSLGSVLKIAGASAAMALTVLGVTSRMPAIAAVITATLLGTTLYLLLLRTLHVLGPSDRSRLLNLKANAPGRMGRWFDATLNWLAP